jgi:hypothetical protein
VTLREFTASSIDGSESERGVDRTPRPTVDPRYGRIFAFIQSDLVGNTGTDEASAEQRRIGQAMLDMVAEAKVNLEVGPLPPKIGAKFSDFRRTIVVDEVLMTYTPHVATILLLHEIVHAQQEWAGQPRTCFEREVEAVSLQNRLWRAWFGPNGKQPPGDPIEAELSAAVVIENQGRLREVVERIYAEQCAGR